MLAESGTDQFTQQRAQRIHDAVESIIERVRPIAKLSPVEFCESIIDLAKDKTSAASGLIRIREKTPYLVDPVNYFAHTGRCKLTIQAVEQTAKSTSWKMGAIARLRFMPSPAGIIYQNESVGKKIIRDSFLPMLRCVPSFLDAVPERANENPDSLDLPDAMVYLMTGESAIISIPLGMVIGDEINKWRQEKSNRNKKKFREDEDYQVSKLKDMDKRTRTFENSLRVLVCSPEGGKAPITTEYKQSSMGVYHLRCLNCGELTFNTTLPEEYFQYKATDGTVDRSSIRLVCPKCGVEFEESDKINLTCSGAYIHEHPERFDYHAGFCWGALASQFPGVDWLEICQAIENAKNSNSYETQAYLCNSIKGVEFVPVIVSGEKISIVRSHYIDELPEDTFFSAVYMAVDTQEVGYWYVVMGIDDKGRWFTLDYAYAWDDQAVIDAWNREYHGIMPMAGIIDEGGHRKADVDHLISQLGTGFYKYKGETSRNREKYRVSENDPLLILAPARRYNAKFLYLIYSQHKTNNNYWYIACELKKTLIHQIVSFQPPADDHEADFEDWTPYDRQHDLFDAHKMALFLHDFACEEFPYDFWRRRNSGP